MEKECCKLPENMGDFEFEAESPIGFRKCKVCGCRHFEMYAEPGTYTVLGGVG